MDTIGFTARLNNMKPWRVVPFTIFAVWGGGPLRIESADGHRQDKADLVVRRAWNVRMLEYYLTEGQPWSRWHFAIQWPLQISFHWFTHAAAVGTFPEPAPWLGLKHLIVGYGPLVRTTDAKYHWKFFLGGSWK